MREELECEVAQDLLEVIAGKGASKASVKLAMAHVRGCEKCRRKYEQMRKGRRVARHHRWTFQSADEPAGRYFAWAVIVLTAFASIVCGAVNYSMEAGLSWSLIVLGALTTSAVAVLSYAYSERYKFLHMLAAFSAMSPLLLGLIQLVLQHRMGRTGVWYWAVGIPLLAIWLFVAWGSIALATWRRWNGFGCIGIMLALAAPAYIATRAIGAGYLGLKLNISWVNFAAWLTAGLSCGLMGIYYENRRMARREDASKKDGRLSK